MANPQKENGFTPIANEILDKIVNTALLGSELQVLFFIIRKTYGYHKKKDRISLTQFEKGTGLSRPTIVKTLKNLMSRNMIVKVALPDEGIEYTFQKNHEQWVVNTAKLVKHNDIGSKARLTDIGKDGLTHKRKKDNTKDIAETSSADVVSLIKEFEKINPAVKRMYGNTTQRKACQDLIDTYGLERVLKVIGETLPLTNKMTALFFPNISTPLQLYDKWQKLEDAIVAYKSKKLTTNKIAFQ